MQQKTGAAEDDAATVAGTEVQKADSHHQSAKNVSALSRGSVLAHLESEVCELKKEKALHFLNRSFLTNNRSSNSKNSIRE